MLVAGLPFGPTQYLIFRNPLFVTNYQTANDVYAKATRASMGKQKTEKRVKVFIETQKVLSERFVDIFELLCIRPHSLAQFPLSSIS